MRDRERVVGHLHQTVDNVLADDVFRRGRDRRVDTAGSEVGVLDVLEDLVLVKSLFRCRGKLACDRMHSCGSDLVVVCRHNPVSVVEHHGAKMDRVRLDRFAVSGASGLKHVRPGLTSRTHDVLKKAKWTSASDKAGFVHPADDLAHAKQVEAAAGLRSWKLDNGREAETGVGVYRALEWHAEACASADICRESLPVVVCRFAAESVDKTVVQSGSATRSVNSSVSDRPGVCSCVDQVVAAGCSKIVNELRRSPKKNGRIILFCNV